MIPNQPIDGQKKIPSLFDLFGIRGNGKPDYGILPRTEFLQKLPDDGALRIREF
jgi:hypothetical protein